MDPIVQGAAISAGAGLLGASMGKGGGDAVAARNQQRWQYNTDKILQREFAQNGIRWRVEDAQAAGLHPLYALGGAGATYTPSASVVSGGDSDGARMGRALASAGQDVGRAVAAQETQHERLYRVAQLKALEASTDSDFAQASYWRAKANEINQGAPAARMPPDVVTGAYGSGAQSFPVKGPGAIEAHPLFKDAVRLAPDDMVSRDFEHQGQTAGRDHSSMRQFILPGGLPALLPATQGGGVPEEIDFSMLPFILGANIERYGFSWISDMVNYWMGASPDARRRANRVGDKYWTPRR